MHYRTEAMKAKQDAAWTVAQRLQQFGAAEISIEVSMDQRDAASLIREWETAHRVRQIAGGRSGRPRAIFEIIPDEIKPTPIIGDATDQMWTTMRKFRSFNPVDLVAHCAVAVPLDDARSYCRTLLAGGYLKVLQKAVPGQKEAIYRLSKATGPKAPRKRRMTCIIDANLGTVTPLEGDIQ